MNEKLLSSLSMAKGAGKLKIGHDAAIDALRAGAPLAVAASDASDRTRNDIRMVCEEEHHELITLDATQDDILVKFGKRFAVAAVTDPNFAALIKKNLTVEQEESNDH